jgi:hypothetical protein
LGFKRISGTRSAHDQPLLKRGVLNAIRLHHMRWQPTALFVAPQVTDNFAYHGVETPSVGIEAGDGVSVAVTDGVAVAVAVEVAVGVSVAVADGVAVAVTVGVSVGVAEDVAVRVADGVSVTVGVAVTTTISACCTTSRMTCGGAVMTIVCGSAAAGRPPEITPALLLGRPATGWASGARVGNGLLTASARGGRLLA